MRLPTILTRTFILCMMALRFSEPVFAQANLSLEDQLRAVTQNWGQNGQLLIEVNTEPSYSPSQRAQLTAADANRNADTSTIEGVAAANGYYTQAFDTVTAVAPLSVTVLSTDQSLYALPLRQLVQIRPMTFFLGSLTPAQLSHLSGDGLGAADLDQQQLALFTSLLPEPFQIVPANAVEPAYIGVNEHAAPSQMNSIRTAYDQETTSVADADVLANVRLHAYLHESFSFVDPTTGGVFSTASIPTGNYTSGASKLSISDVSRGSAPNSTSPYFAHLLIAHVPNVSKPSALNNQNLDASAQVSLAGVKTVNDLVNALAKSLNLELYVDASYGKDPVFFAGDQSTNQQAIDVLYALTLCVHGAWRQVGPAYVLTDDLVGLAARQQFVSDVLRCWSNRLDDVEAATDKHLYDLDWLHDLNTEAGDSVDVLHSQLLTETQLTALMDAGGRSETTISWKELPLSAQKELTQEMTTFDLSADPSSVEKSVDPSTPVRVSVEIQTALELPGTGIMSYVTYPVNDSSNANQSQESKTANFPEPVRGILCAVKTPADAKKLVDQLPGMGLNTLFLDVFTNGRAYFPNSVFAPENGDASGVLAAAISEGVVKNISVFAAVDLLCWRKDGASVSASPWPSTAPEDVNVYGETGEVGVRRRLSDEVLPTEPPLLATKIEARGGSAGWVSPTDTVVKKTLPELLESLASIRGLAGITIQDTAPPGYDESGITSGGDVLDVNLPLGYSGENRLSFLRTHHVDPVDAAFGGGNYLDLPNHSWAPTMFDTSIPGFGTSAVLASGSWSDFLNSSDLALLKSCYQAIRSANAGIPLMMRERLTGLTFDPWTDGSKVDQATGTAGTADQYSYVGAASYLVAQINPTFSLAPSSLPGLIDELQETVAPHQPGGLVLDLLDDSEEADPLPILLALSPYLPPSKQPQ